MYQVKNKLPLYRLNPIIKIVLLFVVTIAITFDYKPYLPAALFCICFFSASFLGGIKPVEYLKAISSFIMLSIGFVVFTLLARGLDGSGSANIQVLFFNWSTQDILISFALGIRILAIAAYSYVFVTTTNPVDLIISLIKYVKLPYKIGYSILMAYRFLPTFGQELTTIRFAHEVRGIPGNFGIAHKLQNFKRYMIPMLASAVRKGERMSFAMESKGFGMFPTRTYYREIGITENDMFFFGLALLVLISIILMFYIKGLTHFSLGFNLT